MSTIKTITPKGDLEWVIITGEGKENLSGKLQYQANLVLDPENVPEHQEYLDKIDKFWEDNKPKGFRKAAKSNGIYEHRVKTEEPDENGDPVYEPTGKVYLAFKTGTTFADGNDKVIKIFNAKNKEVSLGDKGIGNGSVGRIGGSMGIYTNTDSKGKVIDAGVTLYLDRIQLVKFVEYVQDSGFDEIDDEDGWMGDEEEGFESVDDAPAKSSAKAKPRL